MTEKVRCKQASHIKLWFYINDSSVHVALYVEARLKLVVRKFMTLAPIPVKGYFHLLTMRNQ